MQNVYIQVTNKKGSTRDPPVVVEASITSDLGRMTLQRLRQLAEIIRGSSRKNLGLDNSVFGKVKEVILSSRFNHPAHALPPSPSPSPSRSPCSSPYPSPDSSWDTGPSVSPAPGSQSDPPSPVRFHHSAPCSHCHASTPASRQALAPSPNYHSPRPPSIPNTPAPSVMHNSSNRGHSSSPSSSPTSHTNRNLSPAASSLPPPKDPKSEMPLGPSPLPVVSYVSTHGQNNGKGRDPVSSPGVLPSISESSSCKSLITAFDFSICEFCSQVLCIFVPVHSQGNCWADSDLFTLCGGFVCFLLLVVFFIYSASFNSLMWPGSCKILWYTLCDNYNFNKYLFYIGNWVFYWFMKAC